MFIMVTYCRLEIVLYHSVRKLPGELKYWRCTGWTFRGVRRNWFLHPWNVSHHKDTIGVKSDSISRTDRYRMGGRCLVRLDQVSIQVTPFMGTRSRAGTGYFPSFEAKWGGAQQQYNQLFFFFFFLPNRLLFQLQSVLLTSPHPLVIDTLWSPSVKWPSQITLQIWNNRISNQLFSDKPSGTTVAPSTRHLT